MQAAECCLSIRTWYSESKCCRFTQARSLSQRHCSYVCTTSLQYMTHSHSQHFKYCMPLCCKYKGSNPTRHTACHKDCSCCALFPNSIVGTDSTLVPVPGSIQQLASGVSTMGRHCTQQPTTAAEQGFEGMHHSSRDYAVSHPAQHAYSMVQAMKQQSLVRQQH